MAIIDWIKADPLNHLILIALALIAIWLFFRAIGSASVRRGKHCGHPLRSRDHLFCRNPLPDPGERCAAGHRRPWPFEQLFAAILVAILALAVWIFSPLPHIF